MWKWYNRSLKGAGAVVYDGSNDYLNIIIRNKFGIKLFEGYVTRGNFFARNVHGKFYWGNKKSDDFKELYIRCYVDGEVNIYVDDGEVETMKTIRGELMSPILSRYIFTTKNFVSIFYR